MSPFLWLRNPCEKAKQEALQEIGGERSLSRETDAHLENCPPCADYRRDQNRIQAALPKFSAPAPSAGFSEKTLAALQFAKRQGTSEPTIDLTPYPRRWQPVPASLSIAAGLLLVFGLTWLLSANESTTARDGNMASVPRALRPVGRAEMLAGTRDVALLGLSFPSRSARIWNFR